MKAQQFHTNINCNNCVAKVTPHLDAVAGIVHWEGDTNNPQKILTVYGDNVTAETVEGKVKEAGYRAERLPAPNN